jgi:hypothetical protein
MQFGGQIISVFQKIAQTADLGRSTDTFIFDFFPFIFLPSSAMLQLDGLLLFSVNPATHPPP